LLKETGGHMGRQIKSINQVRVIKKKLTPLLETGGGRKNLRKC